MLLSKQKEPVIHSGLMSTWVKRYFRLVECRKLKGVYAAKARTRQGSCLDGFGYHYIFDISLIGSTNL